MKDHRLIDQRSLALDQLVVVRLRADPSLVAKARDNLRRWMPTASPGAQRTLREWETLIDGPRDQLIATLEGTDDRSTRLRQSSPFCGLLSARERLLILKRFHKHDSNPA